MSFGIPPQTASPASKASLRTIVFLVFLSDCLMAVLLLIVLAFLFGRPYHAIKARAELFDAATNCASVSASQELPGPCRVEWANVRQRFYESHRSGKAGTTYSYLLHVRGGYGDMHNIELKDTNVWWRTTNGIALKLQRYGDLVTAIQLPSGETSMTADNPDWQMANEIHGLRTVSIMEMMLLVFACLSGAIWRVLPQ